MNSILEPTQRFSIHLVEDGIELHPASQTYPQIGRLISIHGSYQNAYQYGNKLAEREQRLFVNYAAS